MNYQDGVGLGFAYSTDGSAVAATVTGTWSPSINTWYHIAAVRTGATIKLFIDGAQIGTDYNIGSSVIYNSNGEALWIGAYHSGAGGDTPGGFLNGWIDEFRVTKGAARWTANFTT